MAYLFGAALLCAVETLSQMTPTHAETNWVRDPRIAVQEEYGQAVKRGTIEALELFIVRDPQSELAADKCRLSTWPTNRSLSRDNRGYDRRASSTHFSEATESDHEYVS